MACFVVSGSDVVSQTADRGFITGVDVAHVAGEVHVCSFNGTGELWHAVRRVDGSWTGFGDVEGQTGDRGSIHTVSVVGLQR